MHFKILNNLCLLSICLRSALCLTLLQPHRPPPAKHEFSSYAVNRKVSGKILN